MNYDTVVGINKNPENNVAPIVMVNGVYNSIDIHPKVCNFNEQTGRGWFAVNLSRDWSATERLVFDQEWDTVDARWEDKYGDTRYDTYLRVTYKVEDKKVKCEFTNGTMNWYSFKEFLDKWGTHDYSVEELKVKPYFYTNDIGKKCIAGQLGFMSIIVKEDMSKPLVPDTVLEEVVPKLDIPTLTKDVNKVTKAIEEEKKEQDKRDKLFKLLELVGLTPREALEILVKNAY